MLSVSGGKYTTYRAMAERAINLVQHKLFSDRVLSKNNTSTLGFMGEFNMPDWPSETQLAQLSDRYRLSRESLVHLIETYGMLYKDILNTISYHPESSIRFDIELPMILAELKYAISKEWVRRLDDFLLRRTYYGHRYFNHSDFLSAVASQFKQMTGATLSEDELLQSTVDRLKIYG
jgi:glycerol-3-phosphate dehydrogenase